MNHRWQVHVKVEINLIYPFHSLNNGTLPKIPDDYIYRKRALLD